VANDSDTAANETTPVDNNTIRSDPDSDDGDGKGGKDITASKQADKSFAGMFSTHLKEKATPSARVSKKTRLQRGRWREKYAEMSYEERQEYFKVKHQQVHEKALISTQPEREAKMETKRKNREWSKNSKVIEGIFRKPAKRLQKEKKQVVQLLDEKFPPTEANGETPDKSVSQISHLKYIPPLKSAFTAKERNVRRKAGLINKGYEMHVSAYYQGLTFDKKEKLYIVNEWNHMWVRHVFAEPFLTLVKNIGKEETQSDVLVLHRKWIPVPVGESSNREVTRDLVADVQVQYQQGDVKTCLFHSLASAFHHLGRKHTGSMLASMAKKLCNLPVQKQLDEAIKIVKNHNRLLEERGSDCQA
jgi:hypothetical protein